MCGGGSLHPYTSLRQDADVSLSMMMGTIPGETSPRSVHRDGWGRLGIDIVKCIMAARSVGVERQGGVSVGGRGGARLEPSRNPRKYSIREPGHRREPSSRLQAGRARLGTLQWSPETPREARGTACGAGPRLHPKIRWKKSCKPGPALHGGGQGLAGLQGAQPQQGGTHRRRKPGTSGARSG